MLISRLLIIKKIKSNEVDLFLNPKIRNLMPNPFLLKDMEKGVDRLIKNILSKDITGIFGDYDVDGATATALLGNYFSEINHHFEILIPDRKIDGYGPSEETFNKLIKRKSKLIITVDCGTVSFAAINYASQKNVSVIVLDHHQSETSLPDAHAVVNPNRIDDKSKLNYLCAAGVTIMFLTALNSKLKKLNWFNDNNINEPNLLNYLDLVCLGTICDVVPLIGLNRAFVKQGLKIISNKKNIGIKSLYDIIDLPGVPNVHQIGYMIGPRINAGGRVGKSSHGSDLLMTKNISTAHKLATDLQMFNEERKFIENKLIDKIDSEAKKNLGDPVLVLSGYNWHEGIIGIVAARIKDKYNRPTFIISLNDNKGKGSARSVFGFDIGASIISAVHSSILSKGGGHKMAGGFSIDKNKIDEFKIFLIKKFKNSNAFKNTNNYMYIDSVLSSSAINEDFYSQINLLSPFGSGNSEPKFLLEKVKVLHAYTVGKKHLKITFLGNNRKTFKGMAFNVIGTNMEGYLSKSYKKNMNIVGKLSLNEWRGKRNIEFIIDDISVINTQRDMVPSSIG